MLLPQLCSPCKLSSFSCAFLFVLAWTCNPAIAQERDACSPSPGVKAALEVLPKQTPADTEWDFHQKLIAAIQDLLRKYPGDFFVQKQYVNAMDAPTDRANVIEEYKGKRASGSDSADILYLYGMALLMLNDNNAGKPEGIHMMIGRRPYAAFGNSTGDQQMLEYTRAGNGERLAVLLLHDDAAREYAYGPAQGLPETKVGTFTQALYDEAKSKGWTIISMKNDWKRVLS